MSLIETLKKQIEEQAEDQEDVQDLDIEGVKITKFTPEIASLFTKYDKLVSLALSNCELTTLEGFPVLPGLENLILENNKLDGSAVKYIAEHFQGLQCLSLAENKIKTLQELDPLKQLKQLQQLDLSDNPVATVNGYHDKTFNLITGLKVLDNKDSKGNEIQYSDEDEDNDDVEGSDYDDDGDDDVDESEEESPKPRKKK